MFVKPQEEVIDWRTEVSGIRPSDVENGEDFYNVQKMVAKLIQGRLLVGHQVDSDLKVMYLSHPKFLTRDTATFHKLCPAGAISLKNLCKEHLGIEMQIGEHSSVEDARETMNLYKNFMMKELRDYDDDNFELIPFD